MNPNDEVRDVILRELNTIRQKARSPKTASVGIQDLARKLKPHGYKQQLVASNLVYLVDKGWAREVREARTFTTKYGTTQNSERITYIISAEGVDRLEGASMYRRTTDQGVNITNIQGVTVVGEGNVVNTTFADLSRTLTGIRSAVLSSNDIPDKTKLEAVSDIDTLQAQLQKPTPDKSIAQRAWQALEKLATVGTLAELITSAAHLIKPLIG
jgi:hypothetical protein